MHVNFRKKKIHFSSSQRKNPEKLLSLKLLQLKVSHWWLWTVRYDWVTSIMKGTHVGNSSFQAFLLVFSHISVKLFLLFQAGLFTFLWHKVCVFCFWRWKGNLKKLLEKGLIFVKQIPLKMSTYSVTGYWFFSPF